MSENATATDRQPTWSEWVALNIARGCSIEELRQILLSNGFSDSEANQYLDDAVRQTRADQSKQDSDSEHSDSHVPLSRVCLPGAVPIDTDKAEVFGVDNFLSERECVHLIQLIRHANRPSTTTDEGVSSFRTSQTCELASMNDAIVNEIDRRICCYLGIDASLSEPIEGQLYEPGQEFKAHTDYFNPTSPTYGHHIGEDGQRTWTVMIYLNSTRKGGATVFPELAKKFLPHAGAALIWNNRDADGDVNPATLHQGMPVKEGFKAVITKWFRSTDRDARHVKEPNETMAPLTRQGFLKTEVPPALFESLSGFYQANRHAMAAESIPDYIKGKSGTSPSVLIELADELSRSTHEQLQPLMEAWIGHCLEPTYVYGVREYRHGTVLKMHRDRLATHVASAILNIDQVSSTEWPLVIEDHVYRRHDILLAPGEMVLYEGCRLLHGRPQPFDGERFANVFVHYMLRAGSMAEHRDAP